MSNRKYTKEELIKAQHAYNLKWKENPQFFIGVEDQISTITEDNNCVAVAQIEYLLSIADKK